MVSTADVGQGTLVGLGRSERRRDLRYPFMADVEIVDVESGIKLNARTSDFSRGGCYVDMFNPLPQDTVVKVRLMKWQQTLETQAKVVYSLAGMGMGLMFGALDATQRATVETWLTQVCGAKVC